ncbi:MAG: hypothetical protein ACD_4C00041G0005, partial [uncultured bacterium (gcode 4)]
KLNVWNLISYEENVNDPRYIMKTNINVQMADLLKWKNHNNTDLISDTLPKNTFEGNWTVKYFDFSNQEISASNENNKWKILTLKGNNTSFISPTDYKLKVTWQKTIIVKWWNLYINADIYNEDDKNSLLVIVVKRDPNHYENWWNIYINPDVTNIDAVLIADWSILNFNWTSVVSSENSLRRQLLIFWHLSSSNTTWTGVASYWSDAYIKYWKNRIDSKYDIKNFRFFSLIPNFSWECVGKTTAPSNSGWTWILKYAFAWKKQCWTTDSVAWWLRGTNDTNPLILQPNPNIQLLNPFILQTSNR